jgi:hypothetical protein
MVGRLLVANVDGGADLERKLMTLSASRGVVLEQRRGSEHRDRGVVVGASPEAWPMERD